MNLGEGAIVMNLGQGGRGTHNLGVMFGTSTPLLIDIPYGCYAYRTRRGMWFLMWPIKWAS